ncbi:MFS transporter [Sphingobium lactosutens]|uniref:MFS transporter n=1 Tax=Sphingobium lactosutens TaxID=522773 RepID=UPI0015BBDE36|nr:MFS transporter [Sphingobium lactosutens]NWK96402.1 MFS transporter [Sphingobium lactosutens]
MATVTFPATPARRASFLHVLPGLLILALTMAAGFTMMGSFSMVQEGAKAEMGLSDFHLSLVQGVAAAVPLVLFSIPIGIMVDRMRRLRLFIGLAIVWTVGTFLTATAQNVPMLFLARMLAGVGTTGALTAALSLAADMCAPQQRGRALLIVTLGKSLGQAGAFALAGWLLSLFLHGATQHMFGNVAPWRATHFALAAVSAALVLPMLMLREPARHEVEAGIHAPWRVVLAELWSRRAFLGPLFLGQVTVVMADAAAAIWASPVLSRSYGLAPPEFAGWMGSLIFLTGLVGSVLGGFAADMGQKSGRRGGLLLGAVIAAGLGIPAALFPVMPDIASFAVALGALMLCGTITGLVTSVALTVLLPNELRGLCIGAFIAIAGLVGFGMAPTLVTAISALLGGEAHLAEGLAIVGVVVSIISFFAFRVAMRRAPAGAV